MGELDLSMNKLSKGRRRGRFDEVITAIGMGFLEGLEVFIVCGIDEGVWTLVVGFLVRFGFDEFCSFLEIVGIVEGRESKLLDGDFVGEIVSESDLEEGKLEGKVDGFMGDLVIVEGTGDAILNVSGMNVEIWTGRYVGLVEGEALYVSMTYLVTDSEIMEGRDERT
jgi:hypothetical protein